MPKFICQAILKTGETVFFQQEAFEKHQLYMELAADTRIKSVIAVSDSDEINNGTYDIHRRSDGTLQLRLSSPVFGLIDIIFNDGNQMLDLVAGQHIPAANELIGALEKQHNQ